MSESLAKTQALHSRGRLSIIPGVYGEVVYPGSRLYDEIRLLLATQFGRVQTGTGAEASYVDVTETPPTLTLPIAVYDEPPTGRPGKEDAQTQRLLGTARVELAGGTLIESMILLQPASPSAQALSAGRIGEVGGFAVQDDTSKATLLDVIDTVFACTVGIANERGIDELWIFPRNGFMSLLRADIPGILAPYRFALSGDVLGWDEQSPRLRRFRDMRLRGLGKWPDIFRISRSDLDNDVQQRRLTLDKRRSHQSEIERLLPQAMLRAQRELRREASALYASARGIGHTASPATMSTAARVRSESFSGINAADSATSPEAAGFLPFADAAGYETQYLRDVVRLGGSAVSAYKQLSLDMLRLEPGQYVLDVGCGGGVDLAGLSEAVGPAGQVVGVDLSSERVREARAAMAESGRNNITVLRADAEYLALPTEEFQRVRTDRVLQHVNDYRAVLGHMWRVLMPGGILVAVEPDWATIAVNPASTVSEDDDSTLMHVLGWCRRHLRHPLIGRLLHGLLHEQGARLWQDVRVTPVAYSFSDWKTLDSVLLLSKAALSLRLEQPELAHQINSWLDAVEKTSRSGTFFGTITMYFATGKKSKLGLG